jgi:hypothetical protein
MTATAGNVSEQGTAAARYAVLAPTRNPFLERGRKCAALTVPALLPPAGFNATTALPTPWQSLGARGVNNISAKLLITLFPPNTPCFRYAVDDFMLEQLTQQKGLRAQVEKALNKIERAVTGEIESTQMRPGLNETLKQLVVVGNALIYKMPTGGLRVYRLDQYVCKRDPAGHVIEGVTYERISPMEVPESIRQHCIESAKNSAKKDSGEDTLDLYTHIQRTPTGWSIYQECAGKEIPGSRGTYPADKLPWLFLRFITIDGEDYGRGYIEELLGDLQSLEALQKAIVQGAAAAAKVLFLVKPNGSTKVRVLTESESGDVKIGNKDDVTVLQMDKYADFRVALETRVDLIRSLSYSFMLHSALQRDAERVTAEEIRAMAQELESALGGIYSTMSQELQLPLVTVLVHDMTLRGRLPSLPKSVRPVITTGVEAIGRGNDLNRLGQFLRIAREALGEQAVARYLNVSDGLERLGASLGIDTDGLVKTQEQVMQELQQEQMAVLAEKLGPEALRQYGAQQPQ